jgi:hypothetical protein
MFSRCRCRQLDLPYPIVRTSRIGRSGRFTSCVYINFLNSGDVRYLRDIGQFTRDCEMPMDVADLI